MNIDRLTTIAEWLEAGAPHRDGVDGFDMSCWVKVEAACGTTCCIAGAAATFFTATTYPGFSAGQKVLDLSSGKAQTLFCPHIDRHVESLDAITPAWAARCIRKLIATGEVDWEGTRDSNAAAGEAP